MNYHKRYILLASIIALPLLFGQFTYRKSGGSHPGSTGAPPENLTCSKPGCHSPALVSDNDTVVNKLIFPTPNNTYVPGTTYKITLQVKNPGITRFGFEILALKNSSNTNTGTFTITDPDRTHLLIGDVGTDERTSVTHSTDGTLPAVIGFNEWTFDWTAPPVNEGDITFYYATNSADHNNTQLGDAIYVSTFKISPSFSNSIAEYIDDKNVNALYDNRTGNFILQYTLKSDKQVNISIHDNLGRIICQENNLAAAKGQQKHEIVPENKLSKGVYFINLVVENAKISKKVMIN